MTWNENLRLCREKHEMSQKQLSKILGTSERTLQRYESGESEPTVSILLKLSKIYDTSIDNILGNELNSSLDVIKVEKYLRRIEGLCETLRHEMYESENDSELI